MFTRRTLAVALLCALPVLPAFAAEEAAAPTIKWVVPWKPGTTLQYATEDTTRETQGEKVDYTRATSNATVKVTQASADGYVQTWSWGAGTYDVLEGDKSQEALMRAFGLAFKDISIEVDLNKEGNFTRMRNIADVAPRMRTALRAVLHPMVEDNVAKIEGAAQRETKRKEMQANIDGLADRISAPAVLEGLLTRNIQSYNGFVGVDLEPDMEYAMDVELPNPLGGANFPAKLAVSLSVSDDQPDDIFVAFVQTLDAEKAEPALIATGEALLGKKLTAEQLKEELDLAVQDEGMFLVHVPTGVIEMFESKRTTKINDKLKVERLRMRLTNGEHAHEWAEEQATDKQATEAGDANAEGEA
jgi:hypothetical protein